MAEGKTAAEVLGGKHKKGKSGAKKAHYTHTHIEHHGDGSHTVRHTPKDGGPETSYAAANLDGVHQGIDQNIGAQGAGPGGEPEAADAGGGAMPMPMAAAGPAQG